MRDCREEWYDEVRRVSVVAVDVTTAAGELARAHLNGPVSAHYLAKALAAAALLASETSHDDEVVAVQMKCSGPLGGFYVECSAAGDLRGYTEKKILDEFDGAAFTDKQVVGESRLQITRSIPGRILSQGLSNSFDGYLASSLQRRALMYLDASVNDEVEVIAARGVLVEALPDSEVAVSELPVENLFVSPRKILSELGLKGAEKKRTTSLRFRCRCSPERAVASLGALSGEERATLPENIDITCHMCGRIFTVSAK